MNPPDGEAGAALVPDADAALVSRSCEVSDVSFGSFLAAGDRHRIHWAAPDGLEVVGGGAAARLTADGPDRFETLRRDAETLFSVVDHEGPAATRPRVFGGLAFGADHDAAGVWEGFPAAAFTLPAVQLTRVDDGTYLTVTRYGPDADADGAEEALAAARDRLDDLPMMRARGEKPGVVDTEWLVDREEWTAQVASVIDRIRGGDLRKVVLATALRVDLAEEIDIPDTLGRLRRTYPECYRFLVQPTGGKGFFGPPPERLVRREGEVVETEALAGSMPRGDTPEADAEYARSLLESDKLQHEQRLVVDTICEQLDAFGTVGEGQQDVRKLTNIQHLQTPINAVLDGDTHVLTLVEALHPTPAVGGLPLDLALSTIRETETWDRGWYASPVGWFDAAGDGEFAVGIRSGVAGGREATLFAGNGIVGDSDPADEWDELQPKVRPIMDELEREARTE
ncbi:isochorismate synthase [Halobaculum magnesiiphilum]|uniref:isochorismate synthase n=1 Tax=Halobaculum magnesiiphilum TaxID=1017351 RepID=A0A8T8WFI9_9EURY|nr:isochorismate synthase [Halobaculum magnesiiphilum]QZP38627.1 isochorismate synthase [Halobaculum magnesiiphilum]